MKNIQNWAAFVFIGAVIILSGVSILGVWDFFNHDVIHKSVETLGLLALISIIVMVAGRFLENHSATDVGVPMAPNPAFKDLRRIILVILIIAVSVLALLGVLAIWGVFADNTVLYKSLGSVAILAFSSFVIVLTCLDRENNPMLHKKNANSAGPLIGILILMAFVFIIMSSLYW